MFFLSNSKIIIAITLSIISVISLCLITFFTHRKNSQKHLIYHKYNKRIIHFEKKHNCNLVNKKIRYKKPNPLYLSHIKKNVDILNDINTKINDIPKLQIKKSDTLINIEPLSISQGLIDTQESLLLNDIVCLFKPKYNFHITDELLLKIFKDKDYLYFKNRYIFLFNQFLINVPIIDKFAYPTIIKTEKLSVKVIKTKENKKTREYLLQVFHHQKLLIQLKKKVKIPESSIYESLINLVEYYDVFYKCPSLKEATTKSEHLKKMNEQTLARIQTMSGKKFINWIQNAFKSVYGQEPILKQAPNGSYYLLLNKPNENKSIVIQVKRHSENVSSTYIKELKAIQVGEMGDEAWIISSSSFTKQAKILAKEMNVRIFENEELMEIIKEYNHNYYRTF